MLFVVQAEYQRAGVRFLQHDVRTDYDEPSDVARLYRIRATPSFAFFSDGSKVSSPPPPVPPDCRRWTRYCAARARGGGRGAKYHLSSV